MFIETYLELIRKEFDFLFKDYGFKLVYSQTKQERVPVLRLGFEANSCRILFVREQGGGVIFLGTSNTSFTNELDGTWVSLIGLLGYILKKDFDWIFLDGFHSFERVQPYLAFIAQQLRPHCEQLIKMFQSGKEMRGWKPDYKKYVRKKRQNS